MYCHTHIFSNTIASPERPRVKDPGPISEQKNQQNRGSPLEITVDISGELDGFVIIMVIIHMIA